MNERTDTTPTIEGLALEVVTLSLREMVATIEKDEEKRNTCPRLMELRDRMQRLERMVKSVREASS